MARLKQCRVCGSDIYKEPLLVYEGMPGGAQYLPDKRTLKSDRGVTLEVCQCSGCGLVQLANEPVPYHKEVIRAAGISEEMRAFRKRQFTGFVEKYSLKGKKIIEIGCGRGEYLSIMDQTGVKAYGLEQGKEAVRHCVDLGLNVSNRIMDGPFDAFYILSFLEHSPEPKVMLQEIRDDLVENAVGLVEVPNFDMIIREKMFAEFIGDHLTYFTQETLRTALELNGFEVIEQSEVWHDYIISALVRKRNRLDLAPFNEQQEKLGKALNEYIKGKKVAIWGAGHQALAVMALAGLAGKIKYVVDSAPFKQNKFTPATHIPISGPDRLEVDPVDAIIIMAASYSDEVAGLVRDRCGGRIGLAILRADGLEKGQ